MKRVTAVKDISSGNLRVMIIQRKKVKKDGWLFYPSMFGTMALAAVVGFSGKLFTPAGMAVGIACLAWWGICAVANAKAARWGTGRLRKNV